MDSPYKILFVGILASFLGSCIGQNKPPVWNTASYDVLTSGIREDTPISTVVANLSCIDADGDRIKYIKVSADAFQVTQLGQVILMSPLDFEARDRFGSDVEFACVDVDSEGNEIHNRVNARVQFSIDDANDNPPQFELDNPEGYSFSVREDMPVGTTLVPAITVLDADRTVNAKLDRLYFICDSDIPSETNNLDATSRETCNKFRLEYTQENEGVYTASVVLKAPLDYEERPVYSSKLVAVDGPGLGISHLSSTTNIQFNLVDAQDVGPVFTNPGASTNVPENIPVNTVLSFAVSARDGDTGARRPVKLEIVEDVYGVFNLTTTTESLTESGVYESSIIVVNKLDREAVDNSYAFVIKAIELDNSVPGSPPTETSATATATYSIFVSDVNDNPPEFEEPVYYVNVTEKTYDPNYKEVQIADLHIVCLDRDELSNAEYEVKIVSQPYPSAYSVSPAVSSFVGSGSMFLQIDDPRYLDYDVPEYRNQVVVLEARELKTTELFSSTTKVVINLVDLNDNTPILNAVSYGANVSESVNTFPYPLLRVFASDKDSGLNGEVEYRLEGGFSDKFSIDSVSGQLDLVAPLDYELEQSYVFLVYASDKGEIPKSSQAQVMVNVLNFNDLGPVFRQPSYETSVSETSLNFLNPITITAVDNEDGTGRISYSIVSGQSPNNAFLIEPYNGTLSLRATLDYDTTPTDAQGNKLGYFSLTVQASDGGNPPQTNSVPVKVNVIDQNNHSPILFPKVYQATISELAEPGTVVADVNGTDLDGGAFGKITYRLGSGSSGNFRVDPDTGVVTVAGENNFDYNIRTSYDFQILATDGGAPQLNDTANVSVVILDANNKPPKFDKFLYRANAQETDPIGTPVLTTEAQDPDSTKRLVYSLQSFEASDKNGNKLSDSDNYDYTQAFAIDQNGRITINGKLDKDIAQEISFSVKVQDVNAEKGVQTATAQVTIIIEGEPDTAIRFDPIPVSFMNEDEVVGYRAATVTANDPQATGIIYSKLEPSSEYFSVTAGGQILLARQVDYETVVKEHQIIVKAMSTDGLRSATATVTVSINDVNDNSPVFQRKSYYAEISETAQYPTEVVTVLATDVDSSSFGPIDYRISGGLGSEDFTLFRKDIDAVVLVAEGAQLDYNRRNLYKLDILAIDNPNVDTSFSNLRRTSTAVLTIKLIDENNHSPVFKDDSRSYVVPETADVGSEISSVQAFDDDIGENGRITYSLEANGVVNSLEALSLFQISPLFGTIYVATSLVGKGDKKYSLRVRARDNGNVPRTDFMTIDITVLSTEDNDGNPRWLGPPVGHVVYAPEEETNYVVKDHGGNELFFDAEARTGTNITFELSASSDSYSSFRMDSNGRLTIVQPLDRERQESYQLLVYAQDTSSPLQIRTGRTVILELTDKNDNDATFSNPNGYPACGSGLSQPVIVTVEENEPVNTTIRRLSGCDPDGPGNNAVTYELYSDNEYCRRGNAMSALSLNPDGRLVTRRIVDYEESTEFYMCVRIRSEVPASVSRRKRAFDMSAVRPLQDDVAYIEVRVIDQNDNGPKFPSPTAIAAIQATGNTYATVDGPSGRVHTFDARDADGKGNNAINYQILRSVFFAQGESGSVGLSAFKVDGDGYNTGIFTVLSSYKAFSGGVFVLEVRAQDAQNSDLFDKQIISIYVYELGQAVKLVLKVPASQGYSLGEPLISGLSAVSPRYTLQFLSVSEHRSQSGSNTARTDVCFLASDVDSKTILNIRQVVDLMEQKGFSDVLKNATYKYIDRGQCYPSKSSEDELKWRDLWWVLVAVAIFMFICCVILIILAIVLYKNYKKYMKTKKTYLVQD